MCGQSLPKPTLCAARACGMVKNPLPWLGWLRAKFSEGVTARRLPDADRSTHARPRSRSPGFHSRSVHTCQGLRPRRTGNALAIAAASTPVQRLGVVFAHLTQPYQPSPKFTQGKRAQHGKPQSAVRDDQPDAREGEAGRCGVAERVRSVSLLPERKRQFAQPSLDPVRLDVLEVLTVHARRALVGAALGIGVRQNVPPPFCLPP